MLPVASPLRQTRHRPASRLVAAVEAVRLVPSDNVAVLKGGAVRRKAKGPADRNAVAAPARPDVLRDALLFVRRVRTAPTLQLPSGAVPVADDGQEVDGTRRRRRPAARMSEASPLPIGTATGTVRVAAAVLVPPLVASY